MRPTPTPAPTPALRARALRAVRGVWTRRARDLPGMLRSVLSVHRRAGGRDRDRDDFLGAGGAHSRWIRGLGHRRLASLGDTVRLVLPAYLDTPAGRAAVVAHATLRNPAPHTLVPGRLEAVLGYSERDADDMAGGATAPLRYAVVGKAQARFPRLGISEGGGRRYDLDHLWVVSAWGTGPADARYVDGRADRCRELMRVAAALIRRAVRHVVETEGRGVLVMWNWLGWAPSAPWQRDFWTELAKETAGELNRERGLLGSRNLPVLVWQPVRGTGGGRTDAYFGPGLVRHGVTRNADPCGGFLSGEAATSPEAGVRDPEDAAFLPGTRVPVIVNPWDARGFIGGGGGTDATLGGWLVSGGTGAGPASRIRPRHRGTPAGVCWQAASTAYMHNLCFNPGALLDRRRTLVTAARDLAPAPGGGLSRGFAALVAETLNTFAP